MQLGFVIDHSRCIGCHACTVACKSENDVPLGNFRTWVKYTEQGTFPTVRRSFAVLRCNQCSAAPCVTICPVRALDKRADGIVDVDPNRCIGCKSCMQACPYDALYLHEEKGVAEKCHFCAHRVERGLAPACAVVCPTEAIIPGDFDDPDSQVSKLKAGGELSARKEEAGTQPNVWYRDVASPGIDPHETTGAGGWLWANQLQTPQLDAEQWEAMDRRARAELEHEAVEAPDARTTYTVQHKPMWGAKVSGYLFTKSLAAGGFLASLVLFVTQGALDGTPPSAWHWAWGSGLLFLVVTAVLLVLDLKRPERFLYILRYAQWRSWLARGGVILGLYGALLTVCFAVSMIVDVRDLPRTGVAIALIVGTAIVAALTAMYTAWLFAQAKGRVLWTRPFLATHLLAQAFVAGGGLLLLSAPALPWGDSSLAAVRYMTIAALAIHGFLTLIEERLKPIGREKEYERVVRLITRGPYARRHWSLGVALGIVVPIVGLLLTSQDGTAMVIGAMVLYGLWTEEDILVRAGQAVPIS